MNYEEIWLAGWHFISQHTIPGYMRFIMSNFRRSCQPTIIIQPFLIHLLFTKLCHPIITNPASITEINLCSAFLNQPSMNYTANSLGTWVTTPQEKASKSLQVSKLRVVKHATTGDPGDVSLIVAMWQRGEDE